MEVQKENGFYNIYPKSDNVCQKLQEILAGFSMSYLSNSIGCDRKTIMSYLDPQSAPANIPGDFIKAVYEHTGCDIGSLNTLAYPQRETCKLDPSKINSASFNQKTKDSIREALKDEHNHELFFDINRCLELPAATNEQIRCIFHAIIQLCTSFPSYQLMQKEQDKLMSRYIEQDPSTTNPVDKTALKEKMELNTRLEKAQRAHYFEKNYYLARKLYLQIILKYPKSEECHIACLSLLAIHHSCNDWHLELGNNTKEQQLLKKLTDPTVWKNICKIFDDLLSTPKPSTPRKRSPKATTVLNQNKAQNS